MKFEIKKLSARTVLLSWTKSRCQGIIAEEEAKKIIVKDLRIEAYPKDRKHKLMKAEHYAKAVSYLDATLFK